MTRSPEHIGVVTALPSDQLDALMSPRLDVATVVVDGAGVTNGTELMARFADAFGLPANGQPVQWTAFADELWKHLGGLGASRALVLLTHADDLIAASVPDLLSLILLFVEVAGSVATTATGFPRSLKLSLVLLGDGPAFMRGI